MVFLHGSMKVLPVGGETGTPLASLNPDTDGVAKIEAWEKEVYDRIVAADTDNISVRNLSDSIRKMSMEVMEAYCVQIQRARCVSWTVSV